MNHRPQEMFGWLVKRARVPRASGEANLPSWRVDSIPCVWAHTNGIESFWSTLKRAHKGVYHKLSHKHLDRYARRFAGKHNLRDADTLAQMAAVVAGLVGQRLLYRDLRDNGLPSGARNS